MYRKIKDSHLLNEKKEIKAQMAKKIWIGIPNLLTLFWFLLITVGGAGASVMLFLVAFSEYNETRHWLVRVAAFILAAMTGFLSVKMLVRFTRIIIICPGHIKVVYPFRLRAQQVYTSHPLKHRWRLEWMRVCCYRSVTLTDKNGKSITLSDLELESFDRLISALPLVRMADGSRDRITLKDANFNLGGARIGTILLGIATLMFLKILIFNTPSNYTAFIIVTGVCLLLFATFCRRWTQYKRMVKKRGQV